MSVASNLNKPKDIRLKEKVSYGLGNLAANLLLTTANTYMVYYYTDIVGITAAIVGTLLLVAKVIDGVFDLGVGAFLDGQPNNRNEKAHPWIKRLAVPFGIALILMYSVPDLNENIKVIYAFSTYIFAMFIFSAISVPYNTMISLASTNPIERSELSSYRNMLGSVGGWALTVVTLPLVAFLGNGRQGWFFLAVIYGIVASAAYLICYRNTRERVTAVAKTTEKGKLRDKIKTVSKNKYWWIVFLFGRFQYYLNNTRYACLYFYCSNLTLLSP